LHIPFFLFGVKKFPVWEKRIYLPEDRYIPCVRTCMEWRFYSGVRSPGNGELPQAPFERKPPMIKFYE